MTFQVAAEQYLAVKAATKRPVTVLAYRSALGHALRAFGAVPVSDVQRADIEALVASLAARGRRRRTSQLVLHVVRAVLARAVKDGHVGRNVADDVEPVGADAKQRGALTGSDLAKLRAHFAASCRNSSGYLDGRPIPGLLPPALGQNQGDVTPVVRT
jgi:site-specific recombinase XerC